MKIAISGTYSSGKTFTTYALSHYIGMPRVRARTMRELMPIALPGKTLEQCTAAELVQLIVRRHTDRVLHESGFPESFVSDGSSLQEWIYGSVRVIVGINPNASMHLSDLEAVERTAEIAVFDAVMEQLGKAFKDHVKETYDAFVHLPNELELAADGHRPVNERFRSMADQRLLEVAAELEIPTYIVGGAIPDRLVRIAEIFNLSPLMSVAEAIDLADAEYKALDMRVESDRAAVVGAVNGRA